eukprot:gnl/TRDRNA2_/TRDRNA2_56827_c0_seq1.p1 gnl/TRDRNA2_/TRDRNA2_56827_c0~~gnl/TRDRNA2_/TRDRNA2_56827_c0_seq1.p1  ORF type:complete len:295 (-),score=70.31 gnl/TRDRNA2_/TRDRNA2_56827_c0_seq1:72-845(-)
MPRPRRRTGMLRLHRRVYFLLLVLGVLSATQADMHSDATEESEPMRVNRLLDHWRPVGGTTEPEEWKGGKKEDVKDWLRAKHGKKLWGLDLGCSACLWTAKRVLFHLSKAVKGSGGSTKAAQARSAKVFETLPKVCGDVPAWPEFGITGEEGQREFIDQTEAKGKGHKKVTKTGIKKDVEGEGLKKTIEFCKAVTSNGGFEKDLAELISGHKGRVGEIKFDHFLCYEKFSRGALCKKDQVAPALTDEAGDDDDEQEL